MKVYILKKDRSRVYKSEAVIAYILETEHPFGLGPEDLRLNHRDSGEPYLAPADGCEKAFAGTEDTALHVSITDTKERWIGVISEEAVGLDAEDQSRKASPSTVKALHPLEQKYLSGMEQGSSEWREEFLHIWTAKEAYSKYCGEGLKMGFSRFSVLDEDLSYAKQLRYKDRPAAYIHFKKRDGLYICLATQSPCVDSPEITALNYDAPFKASALETAADILDRGMLSEKELRQKLKLKGYPDDDIAAAAEALKERGYLDDASYASRYISRARQQGKGRFRIESELAQKGIEKSAAAEAFDALDGDEDAVSEMELAMAQAERITAGKEIDEKLLAKTARKLAGLGYSSRVIYSVVDRLRK